MTIYNRYIFKNLTVYFLIITMTLISIVWITQTLRGIDLIINKGVEFTDFFSVSLLLIPYLMLLIIPISLSISVTAYLYKFIHDKEMITLKTSGKSNLNIAKPIVYFTILIMLFTYLISVFVLPLSYRKFKDLQSYFKNQYTSFFLQEGIFISQVKDLTVYINSKNDNIYSGIMIYDNRHNKKPKTLTAQKGQIVSLNGETWFELYNGTHQEKEVNSSAVNILHFDEYSLNLSILDEGHKRTIEPTEKYISQLFEDPSDNRSIAHAHFRLSWPLYCLSLSLMSATILINGKYKRTEDLTIVTVLGFGLIYGSILAHSLTVDDSYYIASMYIAPLSIVIASLSALNWRRR